MFRDPDWASLIFVVTLVPVTLGFCFLPKMLFCLYRQIFPRRRVALKHRAPSNWLSMRYDYYEAEFQTSCYSAVDSLPQDECQRLAKEGLEFFTEDEL